MNSREATSSSVERVYVHLSCSVNDPRADMCGLGSTPDTVSYLDETQEDSMLMQ